MSNINSAIIVAVDRNYGMGVQKRLPWKSNADMTFFRETTQNSICIMGRRTYDDIALYSHNPTRPLLVNRRSIVVTSTRTPESFYGTHADIWGVTTLDNAYNLAVSMLDDRYTNIFFIGGVSIFEACIPYINKIYLNMLLDDYKCDTFFPKDVLDGFKLLEDHQELSNNLLAFQYVKIIKREI